MRRKQLALLGVAGVVAVGAVALGSRYASRYAAAREAAEQEHIRRQSCLDYLEEKRAVLVKQCLAEHRLEDRKMEAQAVLDAHRRARSEAVAKLEGEPRVHAMMQRWVDAQKDAPDLPISLRVTGLAPVAFAHGGMHTPIIQASDISQALTTTLKAKAPGLYLRVDGAGCDDRRTNLHLDATVVVHEGGSFVGLTAGANAVPVNNLTYDIDVVACYGNDHVTLASIKAQTMPLREGYTVRSDLGSAPDMAYQEMDRLARFTVQGILQRALGI